MKELLKTLRSAINNNLKTIKIRGVILYRDEIIELKNRIETNTTDSLNTKLTRVVKLYTSI